MALTRESSRFGVDYTEWQSRKAESFREFTETPDRDDETEDSLELARYLNEQYKDAIAAREPYETFDVAWDLFIGNMFPPNTPKWQATIVINKIRAFIIFEQAIMTDQKPRITVDPIMPGTEDAADLLGKLVDRVWDEDHLQQVNSLACLYGLIWGTGFTKIIPREDGKGYDCSAVVPYRIFTNPTCRDVGDRETCEYVIHVEPRTLGWIRRRFPKKAAVVAQFMGADDDEDPDMQRDFIREGDRNGGPSGVYSAQNVNGVIAPAQFGKNGKDQLPDSTIIDVREHWFADDTEEEYFEQVVKDGVPQMVDVIDDDTGLPKLELTGQFQTLPSPIDGLPFQMPIVRRVKRPKMRRKTRRKFPNGRVAIMAGPVVLRDIPNPFRCNNPFAQWKCVDVGAPFGQGVAIGLKDANIAMNRILSQLYNILEKTGNPSYKVKKGAGVDPRSIKNKAGSIIPLDDMQAIEPLEKPPVPAQFIEIFNVLKGSMGEIAGLQDSVMGQLPGGNTAFATVDQLQESGSAPLRLQVRNYEVMLEREGQILCGHIQQFDRGDRPLRERVETPPTSFIEGEDGEMIPIVENSSDVDLTFREYSPADLQAPVQFHVEPVSSLSTSPAGAWARYMDLFQKHLIDAQAFHEKFRIQDWKKILARMKQAQAAAAQAKASGASKPGPKPSGNRRTPKKPAPPMRASVTREQLSATR